MYKRIKKYLKENGKQIEKKFKELSDDVLKIGNVIDDELERFLNYKDVKRYTDDFDDFLILRGDFCMHLLEHYYNVDDSQEKTKFKLLHKGTPYYFMALGRSQCKDYEGFAYYMDMAVVQDNKNMSLEARSEGSAAEKTFLGICNYSSKYWMDNTINEYIFGQVEKMFNDYQINSQSSSYTIDDFKTRFVIGNLRDKNKPFHSIVSSFYSWVHECQYLVWTLNINPPEQGHNGSMDIYYLHLAKGALILESIGKMVIYKLTGEEFGQQLNQVLNDLTINEMLFRGQSPIKINQIFEDSNNIRKLDDILRYVAEHQHFDKVTIFKIVLTIRNTTAHSLNWNAAVDFAKVQKELYNIISFSLFAMIERIPEND